MKTFAGPYGHCAACFQRFDAATATSTGVDHEAPPAVDCWTICFGCGTLHRFARGPKGLRVRPATPADVEGADLADIRKIGRMTGVLIRFQDGRRVN